MAAGLSQTSGEYNVCALFSLKTGLLSLKCLEKVFINKFYFIAGLENEEKRITIDFPTTGKIRPLRQRESTKESRIG